MALILCFQLSLLLVVVEAGVEAIQGLEIVVALEEVVVLLHHLLIR